jgi:hypothetical protein
MSVTSTTNDMLERLGFSVTVATYLPRDCGIDSLEEIVYLDGEGDVYTTIKGVTSPGGTVTTWTVNVGTGATSVTSRNNGIPVSIRAVANLNLCVYYIKHMEMVQRKPMVTDIDL